MGFKAVYFSLERVNGSAQPISNQPIQATGQNGLGVTPQLGGPVDNPSTRGIFVGVGCPRWSIPFIGTHFFIIFLQIYNFPYYYTIV